MNQVFLPEVKWSNCISTICIAEYATSTQDIYHPLRGDTSFFCGEDCHRRFVAIKMRFKLPLVAASHSKYQLNLSAKSNAVASAPVNENSPDAPDKQQADEGNNAR